MPLPFSLPAGVIAIYGIGSNENDVGVIAPEGFLFGAVNQVYDGGQIFVDIYSSVMFQEKDVVGRMVYDNTRFTLLKLDKNIVKEVIPP